jgi:hypothetical protein
MRVRVVRVACLPGELSVFVDDQPDGLIIWVLEKDYSADAATLLEVAFNTVVCYWARKPAAYRRQTLRAV